MIKKLLIALLLGVGTMNAGSWAEYNEFCLYLEQNNVDVEEYEELMADCAELKFLYILFNGSENEEGIKKITKSFLKAINTKTSLWIVDQLYT